MKNLFDVETAKSLLYGMKRIRAVEETIAARYREGKMRCPTHLCTGQEAVSAGVGALLRPDDFAVSTHRAHGHYLGKGGDLKAMLAEIYGKATGCSSGKGGSMHLIDESVHFMGSTSIVGGTIPVGTGLGFSIWLHGTDQVSCVFLGDGAGEEGVFYESLNFAALKKLPVLYVCENNLYSVYSPLGVRQPEGRRIHEMARSIGVRSDSGDGNDVAEVYDKARRAIRSHSPPATTKAGRERSRAAREDRSQGAGPGTSSVRSRPHLRQPVDSSHVRGAATFGSSSTGGRVPPSHQPSKKRPDEQLSIQLASNLRPCWAAWRRMLSST